MNFYQFNCKMDGQEPYTDGVPPPPKYKTQDFMSMFDTKPDGEHLTNDKYSYAGLRALQPDDMLRYAAPEVEEPPQEIQTMDVRLGRGADLEQLPSSYEVGVRQDVSDDEFKQYTGITW